MGTPQVYNREKRLSGFKSTHPWQQLFLNLLVIAVKQLTIPVDNVVVWARTISVATHGRILFVKHRPLLGSTHALHLLALSGVREQVEGAA